MLVGPTICLLGGSFNPIHVGHLQMARSAQAQCMADEVWFIPAGQPWQKANTDLVSTTHRLAMAHLAIDGVHSWSVNPIECDRSGPSYTIDTLEALSDRYPHHRFHWIVGSDQLHNLTTWKHWQSLFDYARIGVVDRDQLGAFQVPEALHGHLLKDRLFRIPMPLIQVSSTDIRRQIVLAASNHAEIRETAWHRLKAALPAAVLQYIQSHSVYGRLID